MDDKNRANAYIYIRMSTDIQLQGHSLERQKDKSHGYAERHNLKVVKEFRDIGVSAFNGQNASEGELGQILLQVETGDIPKGSYLLIESLDRLSRDHMQSAMTTFLTLINAGINIVTLTDEKIYRKDGSNNESNIVDFITAVVTLSRAHEESAMKSYRLKEVWKSKREKLSQKKLTKTCPFWLRLNEGENVFEILEDRAEIVRLMFKLADLGHGSYTIGKKLNDDRVPTFSDALGWHASYVTRILNNRAVLGEFQPHHYVEGKRVPDGEAILNYFPRVVDDELFLRVQHERFKRKFDGAGRKGDGVRNLFSKMAKCYYCGGSMIYNYKGTPPKSDTYLICSNRMRRFSCTSSSWQYKNFERTFLHFIKDLNWTDIFTSSDMENKRILINQDIATLDAKIHEFKLERDNAFDLFNIATKKTQEYIEYINNKLDALSSKIEDSERKKNILLTELLNINSKKNNNREEIINNIFSELDQDSIQYDVSKRENLQKYLRKIIVNLKLAPDGFIENNNSKEVLKKKPKNNKNSLKNRKTYGFILKLITGYEYKLIIRNTVYEYFVDVNITDDKKRVKFDSYHVKYPEYENMDI